jgi:hypothetical protein
MLHDVITVVILLASVGTVRSNHIKWSISVECLEKVAKINTGIDSRGVCVRITIGSHGYCRQGEQLIVAVINCLCRTAQRVKGDKLEI